MLLRFPFTKLRKQKKRGGKKKESKKRVSARIHHKPRCIVLHALNDEPFFFLLLLFPFFCLYVTLRVPLNPSTPSSSPSPAAECPTIPNCSESAFVRCTVCFSPPLFFTHTHTVFNFAMVATST